jgi:hypothetical protein
VPAKFAGWLQVGRGEGRLLISRWTHSARGGISFRWAKTSLVSCEFSEKTRQSESSVEVTICSDFGRP